MNVDWADLAEQMAAVEYGITAIAQHLARTADWLQDSPAAAHDERIYWDNEKLRGFVDHVQGAVERLHDLLGEMSGEYAAQRNG